MSTSPITTAFIGGGNMAVAILGGLRRSGAPAESFVVVEPHALRDWARWSGDYRAWWGWRGDVVGPTEELNGIAEWIGGRDSALDAARP